jgi:hypothetical protein
MGIMERSTRSVVLWRMAQAEGDAGGWDSLFVMPFQAEAGKGLPNRRVTVLLGFDKFTSH